MPTITDSFDSISEFARFIDRVKDDEVEHGEQSKEHRPSNDWDLRTDFDQSLEMGLNGGLWEEGARELQSVDLVSAAESLADIIQPAIVNDISGGAVDIGAYLADDPECFYRLEQDEQVRPVVRIGACVVPQCTIDSHQLMNRGRAIMAMIDALELQGYSVELDALIPFKKGGECYIVEVAVKEAGHPWDASSVAYAMAHPAFSRRIGFKALEVQPELSHITHSGYGRGDIPAPEHFDVYFGYLTDGGSVDTPERALETVKAAFRKQAPHLTVN